MSFSLKGKDKIGEFEIDEAPALDLSFKHAGVWYKIIEVTDSKNVIVKKTDEDGK